MLQQLHIRWHNVAFALIPMDTVFMRICTGSYGMRIKEGHDTGANAGHNLAIVLDRSLLFGPDSKGRKPFNFYGGIKFAK